MGFKARVGVKVSRDPDLQGGVREPCFKCLVPTTYWFVRKDIPCCPTCAQTLMANDVPTKEDEPTLVRLREERIATLEHELAVLRGEGGE